MILRGLIIACAGLALLCVWQQMRISSMQADVACVDTLERMQDAGVDVSDPDAVLERLRSLSE